MISKFVLSGILLLFACFETCAFGVEVKVKINFFQHLKLCDYPRMVRLMKLSRNEIDWEEKILDCIVRLLKNKRVMKWYLISHIIPLLLVFLDGLQCYKEDNPVTITCSLGYFAQCVILNSVWGIEKKQKIINFLLKYFCLNPNFRNAVTETTLLEYALFEKKSHVIVTSLLDAGASVTKAIIPYKRFKQIRPKNVCYPDGYVKYCFPWWWYIARFVWPIANIVIPGHVPGARYTKNSLKEAFLFFAEHNIKHPSIDEFCKNLIPPSLEHIKNNAPTKKYFIKRGYWKFIDEKCDGYLSIDIARHYLDFLWFLNSFIVMKDGVKSELKSYISEMLDNLPDTIEFFCPYEKHDYIHPHRNSAWGQLMSDRSVILDFIDDETMYKSDIIKIPKKNIIEKIKLNISDLKIEN